MAENGFTANEFTVTGAGKMKRKSSDMFLYINFIIIIKITVKYKCFQ